MTGMNANIDYTRTDFEVPVLSKIVGNKKEQGSLEN